MASLTAFSSAKKLESNHLRGINYLTAAIFR